MATAREAAETTPENLRSLLDSLRRSEKSIAADVPWSKLTDQQAEVVLTVLCANAQKGGEARNP